jgi:hypothetical protein
MSLAHIQRQTPHAQAAADMFISGIGAPWHVPSIWAAIALWVNSEAITYVAIHCMASTSPA